MARPSRFSPEVRERVALERLRQKYGACPWTPTIAGRLLELGRDAKDSETPGSPNEE